MKTALDTLNDAIEELNPQAEAAAKLEAAVGLLNELEALARSVGMGAMKDEGPMLGLHRTRSAGNGLVWVSYVRKNCEFVVYPNHDVNQASSVSLRYDRAARVFTSTKTANAADGTERWLPAVDALAEVVVGKM